MSAARPFLVLACLAFLIASCGRQYGSDHRFPLSGTVRVNGQPIDQGAISFIPTDYKKQRVSGGTIQEGVYSVPEPKGANAGPYRVEIRWFKKTGRMIPDRDSGELYEERKEGLPKRYHEQSELTAEVSPAQSTFDFDLKVQ